MKRILTWLFVVVVVSSPMSVRSQPENKRIFPSDWSQSEPSIALSPIDANRMIVGVNSVFYHPISSGKKQGFYYSTNGGSSWQGTNALYSSYGQNADPSVAFGRLGNAFLCFIGSEPRFTGRVFVAKSPDGGISWPATATALPTTNNSDKCYMAVNVNPPPSNRTNHIYVVYQNGQDLRINFMSSTNGGSTFLPNQGKDVSGPVTSQNAVPVVAPNDNIYVVWNSKQQNVTVTDIRFNRSTDGGLTFLSTPKIVTAVTQIGIQVGDRWVLKKSPPQYPTGVRVDSYPSMAVGPNGHIYVAWSDQRTAPPGSGTPDILLTKSTDEGENWLEPVRVNDIVNGDQWSPWIHVAPDGIISVAFYDSRNDPNNLNTELYVARSTDGGASFVNHRISDTKFVPVPITWPDVAEGYMGDYIGLVSTAGKAFPVWMDNRVSGNYQVFVAKVEPEQVTVHQRLDEGSGGEVAAVGRWSGSSFEPRFSTPQTFSFLLDGTEVLHADTNLYSAQKYNRWNEDGEVANHRGIGIQPGINELTSKLKPTDGGITIKTDLLDAPGTTGGNVQFKDPWYIDYNDPNYGNAPRNRGHNEAVLNTRSVGATGFKPDYTTPYDGGRTYKGVFLNQSGPPSWPAPYYSVGAPSQQIGNFTWNFVNWTVTQGSAGFQNANTAQTGVVFNQANTTVSAKLKAHLGSSLATAAAPSSQRKLVKWGGYHHLVYTSRDHIWYTFSSDYGVNWSPEQKVSAIAEGYQNTNPAIDVDGSGNVYVVFESPTGTTRAIAIMQKVISGWQMINIGETFFASAELKPAIAVSKLLNLPKVVVIVRADGYGSASNDPGLYYIQPGFLPSKVSETSASSLNPTFAYYNLAYQENNAIYHKQVEFGPNPVTFSSRTLVSTSFFNGRLLTNISNPNIAVREGGGLDYNSRPVIAWQATDLVFSTYRPIFVRHPVSGGIPPVFVLTVFDWATSNAHGKTPSVTVYQTPPQSGYQNPDVSVVWQDDPTDANGTYPNVVAANKISGNWGVQSTIATSSASSSVAQGDVSQTSSGGALIVRVGSSGPPYALTASERTNIGQIDGPMAKANSTSMDYARSVNVDLAGTGINGLRGVLTLYIRNAPRFGLRHLRELPSVQEDFLRLQAQSPIPDEISYVLSLCDVTIPNGIRNEQLRQRVCALQVSLNGRDFQTLGAITVNDLSALWKTRTSDTIRVVQREREFRVPAVGHVRFSVEPFFFNNPDHVVLIEEITLVDTSSTRLAKSASHEVLPQAFFLHPNYPNPFNPSTQINYDLPEPSQVLLIVYDVLGRKITELVNGTKEAGYHSAIWNASEVASGVYFVRFTATDGSGNVKLSKVSKLLLTK